MSLSQRRRGVRRGKSWGWEDTDVLLRRDQFSSSQGEDAFRGDAWFLPSVDGHVYDGWLCPRVRYYGYGYQRWEWSDLSSWDDDEDRAYHVPAYVNLRRDHLQRGEGARWVAGPSSDPIEASMGFEEMTLERAEFDADTANELAYVIAKDRMPLEHSKWWWDADYDGNTTYTGAWACDVYAVPFAWEDPAMCAHSLSIMGPEHYHPPESRSYTDDDDEIPF